MVAVGLMVQSWSRNLRSEVAIELDVIIPCPCLVLALRSDLWSSGVRCLGGLAIAIDERHGALCLTLQDFG
jgi:hypothetical protein